MLRERMLKALDFEVKTAIEFAERNPLCLEGSEGLGLLFVGFGDGLVEAYSISKTGILSK